MQGAGQDWILAPIDEGSGSAPDKFVARDDEVHVWRATLDVSDATDGRLETWLSPDELQRAAAFRFARDRTRFILRRGVLRALLGRYLALHPKRIVFEYGAAGKPALAAAHGEHGLIFNVSHSEDLAVYAIAAGRAVGVDVESVRPLIEADAIARRYFSPAEAAALNNIPDPALRLEAFFNCWTRKEAYIKATGEGLSRPLDSFDVSLAPEEPARLLKTTAAGGAGAWSLCHLSPAPGFAGAVAAAGRSWRLRCWLWQSADLQRHANP
jgi:4'-phosphopantetheinyl transferase